MKKKSPTDQDRELFHQYAAGTRVLPSNKIIPEKPRIKAIARKPVKAVTEHHPTSWDHFSDEYEPRGQPSGDTLVFVRPGLQHSVVRKLKRGEFRISAKLDLHGMTVAAARRRLSLFLRECYENNFRCVHIVHGKGQGSGAEGPVLKHKLAIWLPQCQEVMAFCSAIRSHGGTGAIYLLLRSKR